jgi:catechol 2,3-dioxygenase-like lactoylglutathione lyase family enzyme
MNLPDAPIANEGFFVTHFFTVKDQEKSKDFYVRILGGKVIKPENPCYIKLANSWIVLNSGGGPTPDKPDVLLETPPDLNRVNSFLNLRVADIWACYKQWRAKGAFLPHRAARQPRLGMALLHARSRWLPHRGRPIYTGGARPLQSRN